MPISGCHDLPLATFNLPSRNGSQSNRKRIPPPPRRLGGGFNPLRGATTGVVIRRRATTGVDGTRGLVIVIHVVPKLRACETIPLNQKPLVPSLCGGMRV